MRSGPQIRDDARVDVVLVCVDVLCRSCRHLVVAFGPTLSICRICSRDGIA
jgi:hypothetical protein